MAVARNPQQAALQALGGGAKSFSPTGTPMRRPGNKELGGTGVMTPTAIAPAASQRRQAIGSPPRNQPVEAGVATAGFGDRNAAIRRRNASGPSQSYAGAIGTGPAAFKPDSAVSFADQYAAAMQGQALAPGQTAAVRTGIPMWMRLRDNALVAQQQAQGANAAAQGMGFVPDTYQQQLRDLSAAPGGMQRFQQQAQIASGQRGYNSGLDLRASAIPTQPVDPNAEALKRLQR